MTLQERFMSKVEMVPESGCWIWMACVTPRGYGRFGYKKTNWLAHRVSYDLAHGPLQDDICVLHRCDVPCCVNPNHLFVGTRADNVRDMVKKGRSHHNHGERSHRARLTRRDVEEIRGRYSPTGESSRVLAKLYGVSDTQILRIVSGARWPKDSR